MKVKLTNLINGDPVLYAEVQLGKKKTWAGVKARMSPDGNIDMQASMEAVSKRADDVRNLAQNGASLPGGEL